MVGAGPPSRLTMIAHNRGYPRIGPGRELKEALEAYWRREIGEAELRARGARLRTEAWRVQRDAGLDLVPVGDFAWYDHVLTASALLGAVPARFGAGHVDLPTYFAMARGSDGRPAMEMTKWFDTNYHYIVPEFDSRTRFRPDPAGRREAVGEEQAAGIPAKPVLLGPLTCLWLGKEKEAGFDRLALLPSLIPAYRDLLAELRRLGIEWVQMDEPALVLDLPAGWIAALETAYAGLSAGAPRLLLA